VQVGFLASLPIRSIDDVQLSALQYTCSLKALIGLEAPVCWNQRASATLNGNCAVAVAACRYAFWDGAMLPLGLGISLIIVSLC
jgi:hypothetical protein